MPNWCHNTLVVEGSRRDLERFAKRVSRPQHSEDADKSPLYFSSLVPEPVNEDSENGLIDDWYSWRIENWGSKWEPNFAGAFLALGQAGSNPSKDSKGLKVDDKLSYKFDTAWSPPLAWIERASQIFPSLQITISYAEVGCGFAGREVFINGKAIEVENLSPEDVLSPSEMWF